MVRKHGLGALLLVSAVFGFAFNGINATSPLFMIQKFNASTWQLTVMMMLAGAAITLTNTFFVPKWVPKLDEKTTGVWGLVGLGFFYILMFFAPLLW